MLSYSSAVNLSEGDLHSTLPLLVLETAFGDCSEARRAERCRAKRHPPARHVRTDTSTHGTLGRTNGTTYCRSRQTNKQMAREGGFAKDGRRERLRKLPRCDAALFPTRNSPGAEFAASHSELSECGQKRFRVETLRHVGSRASRCGGCLLVLSGNTDTEVRIRYSSTVW